jgi:hypothetical protein
MCDVLGNQAEASVMNKVGPVLVVVLTALMAATADAQPPGASGMAGAETVTVIPRPGPSRNPTPLFSLGGVPVGIWTRVPPPYDPAANRSAAANPLP